MANMNRKPIAKQVRVGLNFDKELHNIMRERFKNGKADPIDRKTNSSRRITEAIPRHKFWPQIRLDIINADLKEILR